jgi:hypothetical protein
MIELKRTQLLTKLEEASRSGWLLVVGAPGTGKSWLVRQFAAQREEAGDAVLLLLAEEHNYVESLRQLEESLRTPAGIIPTLKAYTGGERLLIIDSLDSLRAEASQRVFRQLIRQVQRELPDWKVVVSIRSFDAKESLELQRLFPLSGGDLADLKARHIEVPIFNDSEIDEAKHQDVRLGPIFASAPAVVREILRNAFNLWLLIHLLDENLGGDWLYEIESEVQLFERYWRYRISARDDSHDRLAILGDLSSQMVASRTLSLSFRDAYRLSGASQTFQSLLSDEVLRRTQTNRIAYTHNILFDFSVSKLLLDEERLFAFLGDPGRSIFFRPSVSYFLALLWYSDRSAFWSVASRFFAPDSKLPARVYVLPGMAILNCSADRREVEALLMLSGSTGVHAVLSLLRAIQAFGGMTSRRATLWLHLLCELSTRLNTAFLNEYLALSETASRETVLTTEEKLRLAAAAIRLLTWMWDQAKSHQSGDAAEQLLSIAAGRVIPLVTRFYAVDPDNVRTTLRLVLDRIGRSDVSASEAYSLANCLDIVIDADPSFAVDVYAATFAHEEKSRAPTQIGGGKVFVMTSTRAQDYSMAYYILGVRFGHLLQRELKCATLAAIRSVSGQVHRDHVKAAGKLGKYTTELVYAGVNSRLVADRSELWDQGYRDTVSLQLLDALLNRISDLLKSGELTQDAALALFQLIAKENKFPVIWKRVMERASSSPELLPFVVPLLQAPQILAAPETTVVAGDLINRHFQDFTSDQKQRIEAAIWAISDLPLARMYRAPSEQRDRLLGCIPERELSGRSKNVIETAKSTGVLTENRPFFKVGFSQVEITDDELLRQHGADTNTEANRNLLDVKPPLAAFASKYLNEVPPAEDIETILPSLRIGYDGVTTAVGADQRVITNVFATVAGVAESIVKNSKLDPAGAAVQLCRKVIADASAYPYPEASEGADESFDTPVWGSTPKIEAAQAVIHCAYHWGLDEGLERSITTLSKDKTPAVRFHIANGLASTYDHNRELFWQIAESMQTTEKAAGVLVALARTVGHAYIAKREPERVVGWFAVLRKRGTPKRRPEDVFQAVLDPVMYLYVCLNEPSANQLLRSVEKAPVRDARQLQIMADSASYYLTYNIDSSDPVAPIVRARGREVELRVLAAVDRGLQTIEKRSKAAKRASAKRTQAVKQLLMTVDRLVFRLHMLVNANPKLARPEEKPLSDPTVRTFFKESAELWDALVSANAEHRRPMGPSTAHNLMESFNRLLPLDPEHVLKLAWSLITGRTLGYQFDQMAIGEFVTFAERMLADHRQLLREEPNAIRFAEILDVFVGAGWPDATRIVLRMDSAVR